MSVIEKLAPRMAKTNRSRSEDESLSMIARKACEHSRGLSPLLQSKKDNRTCRQNKMDDDIQKVSLGRIQTPPSTEQENMEPAQVQRCHA